MKTITVLLSSYNGEKYIKQQLDSILNQNISDEVGLSILVRDDGSTDSTVSILQEYKEKHGIAYYCGQNIRTSRSFWDLVNQSPISEYYAFCDQDDVWFTDKIQRSIKMLENSDNIPALYASAFTPVDENLVPLPIKRTNKLPYTDFYHSLIYSTAPGCTFVFNNEARNMLLKYKMTDKNDFMHDWLAQKIILINGKMFYDTESTMFYRQHGDNVIGYKNNTIKAYIKRFRNLITKDENIRSNCASELIKFFRNNLESEKFNFINSLANYKKDKNLLKYLKNQKNKFKTNFSQNCSFNLILLLQKL